MGVGASSQYFDTRGGGHNSNNAAAAAAFTKAEKSGNSHVNSSNNNEDDYKQSLLPSEIKKNMACEKRRETTKTDDGEGNRTKASSRTAHIIASAPLTKTILDEATLKIVGNYLKSGNYNARSTLEEEDVALYAYRSTQVSKIDAARDIYS